jgi:hypothetical protein
MYECLLFGKRNKEPNPRGKQEWVYHGRNQSRRRALLK